MLDKKKKKNTTDKNLTYTLPNKRADAMTGADRAATRNFAQAAKKGGIKGVLSGIAKNPTKSPSITVKNPDYKKPANPVVKAKAKPVNNSPVVGQGNVRPLDNQQKKKKKGPSLSSLGEGTLKFKGSNT